MASIDPLRLLLTSILLSLSALARSSVSQSVSRWSTGQPTVNSYDFSHTAASRQLSTIVFQRLFSCARGFRMDRDSFVARTFRSPVGDGASEMRILRDVHERVTIIVQMDRRITVQFGYSAVPTNSTFPPINNSSTCCSSISWQFEI